MIRFLDQIAIYVDRFCLFRFYMDLNEILK